MIKKSDIRFLRFIPLRGPSMWTYRPALEAWVDIGELEDYPSNTLSGFVERLSAWLPSLVEHRCSYGERGGFLKRLEEGTWPAHILEHVTLELQNLAGMPGGFGKARSTDERGVYKVVVRAWHEDITRAALHSARDLVMAAINDETFALPAAITELKDMADQLLLGPSTACIVDAAIARDRNIPALRLSDGNLVQLGYGARQRRIWTAETELTGAIAEGISRDKDLTKQLLQSCGVPIPEGRIVDSADDAWDAAQDIGLPVVVKPSDGNHGRGVFTNLTTREEIVAAYPLALAEGSEVMVERFVRGLEHRLLIVGGRVAAAARGEEAWVTGDGVSALTALIESQINTDPRRGDFEVCPLSRIVLAEEPVARLELARQGVHADSVLAAGQRVLVMRTGNMAFDVTELVHPEVAAVAALAARVVGLDIAGVDLVVEDISRPLDQQRGAIVEVNAGPGLLMHLKPGSGEAQPVGRAIVDHLFAAGDNGRIPVVGITGSHAPQGVARLLAHILDMHGKKVGLACADGWFLGQRQVESRDSGNWAAARRILMNRSVEVAVLENSSASILGEGLAYDRCQVGIVTRIDPAQHMGEFHISTPEQVFNVIRTQVDVVLPSGVAVLNADDPTGLELAALCDGEVIFYAQAAAALAVHRAQGGRGLYLHAGRIMLVNGQDETCLAGVDAPLLAAEMDSTQQEHALAAVAAAWALEVPQALIHAGIETFEFAPRAVA
ncbi:MAG: cyanophycin synthetase [Pseudomonadota bacterium]